MAGRLNPLKINVTSPSESLAIMIHGGFGRN
jgi:hypothetical protein